MQTETAGPSFTGVHMALDLLKHFQAVTSIEVMD